VDGLVKSYGRTTVLDGLSFTVPQGEIFGLLGANGAGKTTAVEIVQGLRDRDRGDVRVLGLDPVTDRSRLRHLVGSQLQSSALPDRLKVGEALRLFARLAGDVVDWAQLRDEWRLGHLVRRPFGALSGGERQRLFLALALVNQPRLVFLDELTQGLDVAARRDTWALIERVRDTGSTVVLVTHFMDEAERLCDRVAVLHRGRITATGRPTDLIASLGGPVHLRFSVPSEVDARADVLAGIDRVAGVTGVAVDGRRVDIAAGAASTVAVTAELARRGLAPDDFTVVRPSLEDVFVALTQEDS
jgi:ABC-2 type transport system ATP-binding protein